MPPFGYPGQSPTNLCPLPPARAPIRNVSSLLVLDGAHPHDFFLSQRQRAAPLRGMRDGEFYSPDESTGLLEFRPNRQSDKTKVREDATKTPATGKDSAGELLSFPQPPD